VIFLEMAAIMLISNANAVRDCPRLSARPSGIGTVLHNLYITNFDQMNRFRGGQNESGEKWNRRRRGSCRMISAGPLPLERKFAWGAPKFAECRRGQLTFRTFGNLRARGALPSIHPFQ